MAHVKAHYRVVGGKTIYVHDHESGQRQGHPAQLHERTAIGKHKDGSHYLRATDAEDGKAIQVAAKKLGIDIQKRRSGGNHHGRVGAYDHYHVQDPAYAAAIHEELRKQSEPGDSALAPKGTIAALKETQRQEMMARNPAARTALETPSEKAHRISENPPDKEVLSGSTSATGSEPHDTPKVQAAKTKNWNDPKTFPHGDMREILNEGSAYKPESWRELPQHRSALKGTDHEIGALKHLHERHGALNLPSRPCDNLAPDWEKAGKPMEFIGKDFNGNHHYVNTEGHSNARYAKHVPKDVMEKVAPARQQVTPEVDPEKDIAVAASSAAGTATKPKTKAAKEQLKQPKQALAQAHLTKHDLDWKGGGRGYLGHEDRGEHTDKAMLEAANHHGLDEDELAAYTKSRAARHDMDALSHHREYVQYAPDEPDETYRHRLQAAHAKIPHEQMVEHFKNAITKAKKGDWWKEEVEDARHRKADDPAQEADYAVQQNGRVHGHKAMDATLDAHAATRKAASSRDAADHQAAAKVHRAAAEIHSGRARDYQRKGPSWAHMGKTSSEVASLHEQAATAHDAMGKLKKT